MGCYVSVSEKPIPKNFSECIQLFADYNVSENYCPFYWDGYLCWPPTSSDVTAKSPCPVFLQDEVIGLTEKQDLIATKSCLNNSMWDSTSNYNVCINSWSQIHMYKLAVCLMAHIVTIFSAISLIVLFVSLFIFFYFKSLHCSRLKVHRNLCVALILYLLVLLPPSVAILLHTDWANMKWLCKAALTLNCFSRMATIAWMFVEGLLLHSRVTVHIFRQDAPFKLYYFIGWGLPGVFVSIWLIIMVKTSNNGGCWTGFEENSATWFVRGPILVALLINTIFLVNVIRVLVTKHQANNSTAALQVKKAMKATALLFPLLGLTHLIFAINPGDGEGAEDAFWIFNSFIRSSQGLFFAILYCFLNSDVQTALRNAYSKSMIQRNPNHQYRMRTFRGMSQTSHTYMSNSDGNMLESIRSKRESKVTLTKGEVQKKYVITTSNSNGHEALTML